MKYIFLTDNSNWYSYCSVLNRRPNIFDSIHLNTCKRGKSTNYKSAFKTMGSSKALVLLNQHILMYGSTNLVDICCPQGINIIKLTKAQ